MHHRRRATVIALLTTVAALGACADDGNDLDGDGPPTGSSDDDGDESDAATGDTGDDEDEDDHDATSVASGAGAGPMPRGIRLAPFDDCSTFLDHVQQEAAARVGPYGLDPSGSPWTWFAATETATADSAEAPAATMAPAASTAGETPVSDVVGEAPADDATAPGVTGTNTQEAGVDEPDIIKTDGSRIVTISEGVLTNIDIASGQPVVTDTITVGEGWNHQMFLAGDRALVVSNTQGWVVPLTPDVAMPATTAPPVAIDAEASFAVTETVPPGADATIAPIPTDPMLPAATLLEIDLSQPADLRISATLRIEGQYLNARLIEGRLLVAVSSGPQWMPWLYPQSPTGEARAQAANRDVVQASQLTDWVPQYELLAGDTDVVGTSGDLLACDRIHRPAEFAGFDMISVVDVDLAAGLAAGFTSGAATGVLAGGQTVYASLDRFYVATTRWVSPGILSDSDSDTDTVSVWSDDYTTDLHAFSVPSDGAVGYVASGSIDGSLLSQFSMDEHEGYLRVFTTDGAPWDQRNLSETRLVVLEEQGDQLVAIGEVGGLGKGEALYSARMIGDRGFAVTFRQTDPFYVLDLSDPTAPTVTGELKIPGFSTYLHPVGDHRVLGVGRSATDDGMVTGIKLSLFDVGDPTDPREISVWTLDDAASAAEYDHHAFQMVGSTAILPVQSWTDGFNGAIVFDIGDAITERGRVEHVSATDEPTSDCRQVVAGDMAEDDVLYWMTVDPNMRVQLCGPNDVGGYGTWYCDSVADDALDTWFGTDVVRIEVETLGIEPGGQLQMCYRNDDRSLEQIQRSAVVDETLWTFSPARLEAHDLATLAPIGGVALR